LSCARIGLISQLAHDDAQLPSDEVIELDTRLLALFWRCVPKIVVKDEVAGLAVAVLGHASTIACYKLSGTAAPPPPAAQVPPCMARPDRR